MQCMNKLTNFYRERMREISDHLNALILHDNGCFKLLSCYSKFRNNLGP